MSATLARPPAPGARAPRPGAGRLEVLVLLLPALVLLVLAWELRWVSEDGFIYLRVLDNLLAGDGPVFNPGERVEAYTGPAWLALLALASAVAPFAEAEHLAVVLGTLASAAGLALGTLGARGLLLPRPGTLVLPLGAAVVAALPPFWDYATSGLEMPLVVLWLGGVWWGLARAREGGAVLAAAIGLGPLIRPDLAIFSAGFLLALVWTGPPRGRRRVLALLGAAALLPVAYQVFRMGYFATLVPNTALAKEPGLANWGRGLAYVGNLLGPYLLPLPLLLLALVGVRAPRRRRALALVAVATALVHALYVVRLGGDYMHARMLLPTLLALLLPVLAVPVPRRAAGYALAGVLVAWALVCATALRASSSRGDLVYDQRRAQLTAPGHPHPVTLEDHLGLPWSQPYVGLRMRELPPGSFVVSAPARSWVFEGHRIPVREPEPLRGVRGRDDRVYAWLGSIGRIGYAGGAGLRIVDRYGLADPVAGRLRLEGPRRRRPGHEKELPLPWALARFADPATVASDPAVAAARAASRCGPLRDVLVGVTAPLTAGRFLDNVGVAVRTRGLRVAPDPERARVELCRPASGG
jgi:arabinofuranosyltransferase